MRVLNHIFNGLMFLFPLVVYLLEQCGASRIVTGVFVAMALLSHFFKVNRKEVVRAVVIAGALLSILFWFKENNMIRLYPFLISLHFLLLFRKGEMRGQPLLAYYASRFKLVTAKEINELRKVNHLWVFGLAINTALLFILLFFFDTSTWTLYAGLGSYLLLAMLFILTFGYMLIRSRGGEHVS